jgi:hypothetical protein
MICINCTFHYSVWSFHLLFSYKFWNGWHQLICWFNVSWTLSNLEVVNIFQSLLLMSLHVVLPHLYLFWCTCSDCCSFCYPLRVGLSPVFECLLHHWYVNVSNSWFHTSWCQVTDADFITPTLLSLLPLSRLVIFVSIPLHDGCISCRLYKMYIFFCCSDLCPLLR